MSSPRIAVIDDERNIQLTLKTILERRGYATVAAYTAKQGLEVLEHEKVDAVLLDLGLPDEDGLNLLRRIRSSWPALPVLVVTANDSLHNAIESIKLGAFHFLSKPYAPEELLNLVHQALENNKLHQEAETLRVETSRLQKQLQQHGAHTLIFRSAKMKELADLVSLVAPTDSTVLLVGESGTGKEVIANLLHQQSPRASHEMIKLNCAAFPQTMIEGELFGYRKGSFTGAGQDFQGVLGSVSGGTLFLDEISEMPADLQTRFLRVLQDHEYRPLGSTQTFTSDFRLVAATNRPPDQAIREGKLREDLYYRINTFQIVLPPLRERAEDIPDLAQYFLEKFRARMQKSDLRINAEAFDLLLNYHWPGNVRELQNVLERAVVLSRSGEITREELPASLWSSDTSRPVSFSVPTDTYSLPSTNPMLNLTDREKATILAALTQTGGNKKRAAQLLGIHRPTLYAKMKKHGINPSK
jgi:DNA-binding NtrC family response regulator